jgi:hypothetical protein
VKHLVIAALALGFLFAAAPASAAGDISPADQKMLHDYTLTMDKVKGLQAAMADSEKAGPAVAEEAKSIGNDAQSLTEMKTKLAAHPTLLAIYSKHGLTADDAVLMPFVLMSAGIAAQYPDAAKELTGQTSPQQIAFMKAHEAELKGMKLGGGE